MEIFDSYALFLKETKYKEKTSCSAYFVKDNKKEKKCGPYDYKGYRYKLDYETGELRTYTLAECQANSANSISRTKTMLKMILSMNDFDWFCTLTFDKDKINRTDDKSVYEAYVKFINNIQHQFPTIRYVTVLERHEDGNIHFHLVIGGVPWQKLGLVNTGKVCCHWAIKKKKVCSLEYFNKTKHLHELKETDGLTIYNITSFIYGFTTATRIASQDRCSSYVMKYVEKALGSTEIFKKRFYYSRNLIVPEIVKRCVGCGFDTPKDIKVLMQQQPLFMYSNDICYLNKYNIAMCRINNDLRENLDKSLIPIDLETSFD